MPFLGEADIDQLSMNYLRIVLKNAENYGSMSI